MSITASRERKTLTVTNVLLAVTVASFFLYLTWIYWTETQYFRIKALIFVPFFLLLVVAIWWRRRKLGMRRLVIASLVDS